MQLAAKTALITGAASGLGEAMARKFVGEGAQVVIADINDDAGQALAKSLGSKASFIHLDVTKEEDWRAALSETPAIDVLINNAGVTKVERIESVTPESVRTMMDVDVLGVLLGCKHGIEAMKDKGGSIINISSALAKKAEPQTVAYCAAKAAVGAITKSIALHCAEQGYKVRCNAILPGIFHTAMLDKALASMPDPDAAMKEWSAKQPTGRLGKVEELAGLATYLASDISEFMTGSELVIDGGNILG
jgi:NAD(P)-dependent dehydrogenase (short-subunit alcohol dehydrogenase family)